MAGGKRNTWIIASVGALVLLVVLVGMPRGESVPSQPMPDGTVVTIAKVSYGRVHRYGAGKFWERIAARVLPDALAKRLGVGDLRVWTIAFTNATDSTVVFIQSYKSNGFRPGPGAFGPFLSGIVVADDVGNDFRLSATANAFEGSNMFVEAYQVPLVSHAAQKFHLQLQQAHWDADSGTNRFAEFTFNNPAPHSTPRWAAPPLPQTNTADDLSVELLELLTTQGETPIPSAGRTGFRLFPSLNTRARFRFFQNGFPTDRWRAVRMTVFDEEGNSHRLYPVGPEPGATVEFEGGFSPSEARKFVFELGRTPPFEPNEIATATNVNVPSFHDSYRSNLPQLTLDSGAYRLNVLGLMQSNDFEQMLLVYDIWPNPEDRAHYLILKAVEGSGKESVLLEHDGGMSVGGSGGIQHSRPLLTPPYRVDLVFALTKARHVEFLARPEEVATNVTKGKL
jgi:hypothetical protein